MIKIVVAANEDGWGPSSLTYYFVIALFRRAERKKIPLKIILLNSTAMKLNTAFYADYIKAGKIRLKDIDSYLKMVKENGEVNVPKTLERWVKYKEERSRYEGEVMKLMKGADLSIDFGVPFLPYCARKSGVSNFSIFDHSWARTLKGICSEESKYSKTPTPTYIDRIIAYQISKEIEKDEKLTKRIFLFPQYITPKVFYDHWKSLGKKVENIPGVLGKPPRKEEALYKLNEQLEITKTNQGLPLSQEPIRNDSSLVLISPGGTPVWDPLWVTIIEDYIKEGSKREYIPVLSAPRVDDSLKKKIKSSGKIKWIDQVVGSPLQTILPAFDMVVTRAGAGTVNDCLASRVPFICIEEHMWQVEMIARECKKRGFTPVDENTEWVKFEKDPVGCIDYFLITLKTLAPAANKRKIKIRAEDKVAKIILECC